MSIFLEFKTDFFSDKDVDIDASFQFGKLLHYVLTLLAQLSPQNTIYPKRIYGHRSQLIWRSGER